MSLQASATQCTALLKHKGPFLEEIQINLDTHRETRRKLENSVKKSIGEISKESELYLDRLLKRRNHNVDHSFAKTIKSAIRKDSILKTLSLKAKQKMLWLVYNRFAPPEVALLIARYLDYTEPTSSFRPEGVIDKIDIIIRSYIYERALMLSRNNLRENPDAQSEKDIWEYLEGHQSYKPHAIRYFEKTYIVQDNLMTSMLLKVETELSSEPGILDSDFNNIFKLNVL